MTGRFKHRAAPQADAHRLGAILSEFVGSTLGPTRLHKPEQDRGFVGKRVAGGQVYMAEQEAALDEFAARKGDDLIPLYVRDGARRQGCRLTRLTDQKCQTLQLRLWVFEANIGANAIYPAYEFAERSRTGGQKDEGLPNPEMQWQRND